MNQKNKIKLLDEEQAQLRLSILRAEEGITKTEFELCKEMDRLSLLRKALESENIALNHSLDH